MYRLDPASVVSWAQELPNEAWTRRPGTFDTVCPNCGRVANFQVTDVGTDRPRVTVSMTARCAACGHNVLLWSLEGGAELYMRPAPAARQPIRGADMMPTAVRRAYQSTINVFNAGEWDATATQTRVTLEGIVHHLLPEEQRGGGPLAQQLRRLAETKTEDLARPLLTLSDALRESGNIGAHFDLTRTTDRETADAMLDLMDYLIEYIYTLPEMIEGLNRRVQQLDQDEDGQPES